MAGDGPVGAVVLAAGQSRRMGQPKMALPWGQHTVIEQVVTTLLNGGARDVVVVTGGAREQVERLLANYPVRLVYNHDYAQSEMLTSLQVGLRAIRPETQAVFVALGDQPSIEPATVAAVRAAYSQEGGLSGELLEGLKPRLIVPSYQMRRGHPWLVDRSLWPGLLAMTPDQTMRDFLRANVGQIVYVTVDSPGVLKDLDTPEDYNAQRPVEKKD